MTRSEELAGELQAAIDAIHTELAAIADDRWTNAITGPEGWPVGHTAHHIGEGYLQSLRWIDQALGEARPVVLDPAVGLPAINLANARCLEEHGHQARAETMRFMSANAQRLIDRVRTLTDAQLDEPMMILMGQARPGSMVAVPMALRHANNHMDSIRGATPRQK